jgi:hypothetical protein
MGDVINLSVETSLDIPVDRILSAALEADLETSVVIGWDQDGNMYFASSSGYGPDVLWLLEKAKASLLAADE